MKNIGIIGSGIVGQTLANGFIKHGYKVMIGTRTVSKLDAWKKSAGGNGLIGSFDDAAAFGRIVVLATKGSIAKDSLSLLNGKNLEGKTIIDATNPIAELPPENGVLRFFTRIDRSLMEELQSIYPKANFVKSFNSVGNAHFVNPDFGGVKPTMFICGNSEKAKKEVTEINTLFGWETEDMGMVEAARAIEPLSMLWCIPGFRENEWNHAFKLLKSKQ
jgi:predicted dinucleotide-binding enzyme